MKKLYIIPFLLVIVLGGCKKHVSLVPVSQITSASFFKTENDVQAALNGMYVRLRNLHGAAVDLYAWGEARSELLTSALAGTLGYEVYYNNTVSVSTSGPSWDNAFVAVNAANLILKYTPDINFVAAATKNDALAQAYTMRAFLYFVLARTFGGVPVRTEPTEGYDPITIQVARSSEADVFKLIKEDLEKAIGLYPNNTFPAGRGKWSKASASALKAEVYLWTGKRLGGGTADFTTALTAITEVEAAAISLLPNYADVFAYTNKGNGEILMAIKYTSIEGGNQVVYHNMYSSSTSYPAYITPAQIAIVGVPLVGNGNVWRITDNVRNQFTNDDTRKAATYIDFQGTAPNQYYTTYSLKFNGTVDNGARIFSSDYILYRYGDVVLMKAEAKNALGQDPSVEINKIRLRAYGATNYPAHIFVPGTKAQNDDAILKERLFEMALEGKRWWDLVRFGKAFALVPSLAGKDAQTHLLYWPIGNAVRSRELLVTETAGY